MLPRIPLIFFRQFQPVATITDMQPATDHPLLLERCARECAGRGWRLAWSLLHDVEDASDALQQALMVAVRKPDQIPADNPWPWLASAIALEARNMNRMRSRRRTMTHDFTENAPLADARSKDPAAVALSREQAARLSAALDELPDDEREALCLVTTGGLSYSAAARALQMPVTSLRLRVERGVEAMRRKLGGNEAGILGCLPLLPVPEAPPGLQESLLAQASGGLAPGAVAIGSLAMKKTYLLWITVALLLCVGVGAGYVLITAPGIAPDPTQTSREAIEPEQTAAASRDTAAPVDDAGSAEAGSRLDEPAQPQATPESETVEPKAPSGKDVANGGARPFVPHTPEPAFKLLENGAEDPRVIATIGGASAWTGHDAPIAIVVHPDDSCLFTVSKHFVTRWDARSGAPDWVLEFEHAWLSATAISPDGAVVAVADRRGWVVLLDSATGKRRGAFAVVPSAASLAYSPDGARLAIGSEMRVRVVDSSTGDVLNDLVFSQPAIMRPSQPARSVRFTADGAGIVAARQQVPDDRSRVVRGAITSWELATGRVTAHVSLAELGIIGCGLAALSRDGALAIVPAMNLDEVVLSYDEYSEEDPITTRYSPGESEENIRALGDRAIEQQRRRYEEYLSRAGGEPNSGTARRFLAIVNLATGAIEQRVSLGDQPGSRVLLALDADDTVVAAWRGGQIRMFNFRLWTPLSSTLQPVAATAMAFDSTGRRLFANHDTRIVSFQASDGGLHTGVEASGLKPDDNWINVSGDGSAVLFMQGGELVSWDVSTREVRWRRAGVKMVFDGAGDPLGDLVIAVDAATHEPLLLDAASGETRRRLAWPEGVQREGPLTAGRDGSIVAQTLPEGVKGVAGSEFVVWQAAQDYAAKRIPARAEPVGLMLSLAISPDGRKVAAATWNGYLIADVATGEYHEADMPQRFSNNVRTKFTPDGRYLLAVALGLRSSVARVDVEKGAAGDPILVPGPDGQRLASFLIAPDGESLVLAPYSWEGQPSTLIKLDLETGQVVDRYPGHTSSVCALSASADGRIAASLCDDRVIRVWRMAD